MKGKLLLLLTLLICYSSISFAQNGRLTGNISDAENNETLIGAAVMIKGTSKGTITDFEGNYSIENMAPGQYEIECSFVSYDAQTKTITILADQTISLNFALSRAKVGIDEVQIVAKANRESENMLLMEP